MGKAILARDEDGGFNGGSRFFLDECGKEADTGEVI